MRKHSQYVLLLVLIMMCRVEQTLAWGPSGHALVGTVADSLLNSNAKANVQNILGFTLSEAAKWPDCARSVYKSKQGQFIYNKDTIFHADCVAFDAPEEVARMEDYVKRNWDNCDYINGHNCHEAFHFADVAIQHDHYDRAYVGTSDHDIVSAINAAIVVLKSNKPNPKAPKPFNIKDKKEALFLIAHFVGDIHQPLHVGAVYLDEMGNKGDPQEPNGEVYDETKGGNSIHDGSKKLHSEWDGIPKSWSKAASVKRFVDNAAQIQATKYLGDAAPIEKYAEVWATDTVLRAREAFAGLHFQGQDGHGRSWTVSFEDEDQYKSDMRDIQRSQISVAGARLAELLNTLWP